MDRRLGATRFFYLGREAPLPALKYSVIYIPGVVVFSAGGGMRNMFPGHFKGSEVEVKEVWKSCLFVFDANIILNLYRYSDSTRQEFFNIFEKFKDRIWIPNRAAEEFLINRASVIASQEKTYDDAIKGVDELKKSLESPRKQPFVSKEVMSQAESFFERLLSELSENKDVLANRVSDDEIKASVSEVFEGCVGEPYDDESIKKIIEEGDQRYAHKIPPGYKDAGKGDVNGSVFERTRKYGDLIVWKQILDKAVNDSVDVVLVTDDKKEDWWEKSGHRTIGPRPELVEEFFVTTGRTFQMYQADRFLVLARENLDEEVSEEIVDEVRGFSEDSDNWISDYLKEEERVRLQAAVEFFGSALDDRKFKMNKLREELHDLRSLKECKESEMNALSNKKEVHQLKDGMSLMKDYTAAWGEVNHIASSIDDTKLEIQKLKDEVYTLSNEFQVNVSKLEGLDDD
ncbi:PIN-like domain-containing protein [Halomonas nitroreducens]|uniref:PIN like domain-containing protein n=1 Tax=Halomonas nitroreducens TaxID=447425 RepID=A0A431UYU3_9GAMM|nr:PIN domain-containing protein [Halomonas nitroreducens]RTQ97198.1 hypothetical protein EKG36_20305 [Halomonas nitroreducens]